MADEEVRGTETAADDAAPKKKMNIKALMLIGGVVMTHVLVAALVVFVARGMSGSKPEKVDAAEAVEPAVVEMVEVSATGSNPIDKIRAINAKSGRVVIWLLKVHLRVPKSQKERVETQLAANANTVRQSISETVGESQPFLLEREANHATLKRQIRYKLNKILGKGVVEEVVISECMPTSP